MIIVFNSCFLVNGINEIITTQLLNNDAYYVYRPEECKQYVDEYLSCIGPDFQTCLNSYVPIDLSTSTCAQIAESDFLFWTSTYSLQSSTYVECFQNKLVHVFSSLQNCREVNIGCEIMTLCQLSLVILFGSRSYEL